MAKATTQFICQECGAESAKWTGRCAACNSWNSIVEEPTSHRAPSKVATTQAIALMAVPSAPEDRRPTNVAGLDQVLGGGIVPGSVILIGGEPGVGKSTLVTQAAMQIAGQETVLYVSAEESPKQVKMRTERLGRLPENFLITSENFVESIATLIPAASLVIVDSIQAVRTDSLQSAPGSVGQVRECAAILQRIAKETDVPIVLIGHVTKDGSIAGPRVLEHLVDVVLYFDGERTGPYRVLRAAKNRFGATEEIALFEMGETGLRYVENASAALLSERSKEASGSAVVPIMEGTRCLLAEIQALCTPSFLTSPRRVITGADYNRMTIVLAVMEKRLNMRMGAQDVFINVTAGLRIDEPAADLPALLAAASSLRDKPLRPDLIAFGEVGLGGEIRSVNHADRRLKEAARLGFKNALVSANQAHSDDAGLKVVKAVDVQQAVKISGVDGARS